jgi:hypothetical protein
MLHARMHVPIVSVAIAGMFECFNVSGPRSRVMDSTTPLGISTTPLGISV